MFTSVSLFPFFILLFILTALEHHGVWWPLNSAASNNSVRVKVELKESHFKLTFHYWQPPFDHSTITFNNFISLDYHLNFQAFCKSLHFSFPVYSLFAICCRRSVNVTLPSSLFFLLLYSFFFFTFSSSSHPLHSLLLAHAIFFQHLSKEMALFSFSVLLVDFSTVSTFAVRTKYKRTATFFFVKPSLRTASARMLFHVTYFLARPSGYKQTKYLVTSYYQETRILSFWRQSEPWIEEEKKSILKPLGWLENVLSRHSFRGICFGPPQNNINI